MNSKFFGLISFEKAKHLQELAWGRALAGLGDCVLGFELEPVVTLGARSSEEDLLWQEKHWREKGYSVEKAERGGQATIHNPGQLVIFPVVNIRELGVKKFVRLLADSTKIFLQKQGCETDWNECQPGLYSKTGKVMSLGLRVRRGVVTHGLAINVHNDLEAFSGIRVCGREAMTLDRLRTSQSLSELFSSWNEEFTTQLTRPPNSHNLVADPPCVRL
jgi:lipoate-protein ligase B